MLKLGLNFSVRELTAPWLAATFLSGAPSTVYALLTGGDPLEATRAAGAMLMPRTSPLPALLAAAAVVHATVSLFWNPRFRLGAAAAPSADLVGARVSGRRGTRSTCDRARDLSLGRRPRVLAAVCRPLDVGRLLRADAAALHQKLREPGHAAIARSATHLNRETPPGMTSSGRVTLLIGAGSRENRQTCRFFPASANHEHR